MHEADLGVRYIREGENSYMDVVGIDVSKADFHACLLQGQKRAKKSFPNGPSGYRQLLGWLRNRKCREVHACMEATGGYWLGLARAMHASGAIVSVVNPSRTALFARSQLRRTKTDLVDAEMIAEFCQTQQPSRWEPPAPEVLELRGLLSYREHLVAEQIRFKQLAKDLHVSKKLERLHQEQLDNVAAMLEEVEVQIRVLMKQHRPLEAAITALTDVQGIGLVTAAALVAKLPVHRLRDKKAAAAYVGLCPSERQSGTSVRGKPRICKTGNASLRRDLYMPAVVAMRYNPILSAFAQRLRESGKAPKVIIAAVMRKLVVLAFSLIKKATAITPIAA
jgi:transposase